MGPGQIIKNRINLDLIEIIQFCLKIYDLLTHPHLWVGVWVDGWVNMWVNGDNMGSTWGPQGCADHMGTTWRQHGDKMRTMWRQHGDHRNVETTWGHCGDNMGTA